MVHQESVVYTFTLNWKAGKMDKDELKKDILSYFYASKIKDICEKFGWWDESMEVLFH